MRRLALRYGCALIFLLPTSVVAQDSKAKDPQAALILRRSVTAMGGAAPRDSVATGAIDLVEGSRNERGTVRFLTKGLDQSLEQVQTDRSSRTQTFSKGEAIAIQQRTDGDQVPESGGSLEMALGSQSPAFPLVLVAAALSGPDNNFEYVGKDTVRDSGAHHLRFWNTFESKPSRRKLASLTARDIWIDEKSGLPVKLTYEMREARGEEAGSIRIEMLYSDYRDVGGVLYPFQIEKSVNGTPWATIRIERVEINRNVADSEFLVKGAL